jgi:hypothetical protein
VTKKEMIEAINICYHSIFCIDPAIEQDEMGYAIYDTKGNFVRLATAEEAQKKGWSQRLKCDPR